MGVYKGRMASDVMGENTVDFFILKNTKNLENHGIVYQSTRRIKPQN
jgi:hypothetical protein